jgi:hypothetical protein
MTPEEQLRAAQDRAVAGAPHPGGLAGRVADAHDPAAHAVAAGDIDGAIGAEQLAAALTDAALTAQDWD